jgi:hypothetical protein
MIIQEKESRKEEGEEKEDGILTRAENVVVVAHGQTRLYDLGFRITLLNYV